LGPDGSSAASATGTATGAGACSTPAGADGLAAYRQALRGLVGLVINGRPYAASPVMQSATTGRRPPATEPPSVRSTPAASPTTTRR